MRLARAHRMGLVFFFYFYFLFFINFSSTSCGFSSLPSFASKAVTPAPLNDARIEDNDETITRFFYAEAGASVKHISGALDGP